jgi:hypothetical protein
VKDVMETSIEAIQDQMKQSQDLLEQCIVRRVDKAVSNMEARMDAHDFEVQLVAKFKHSRNRYALALQWMGQSETYTNPNMSFASNAIEEGLRACFDINVLTELVKHRDVATVAVQKILLVGEWFTTCTHFTTMSEILGMWGQLPPFRGTYEVEKHMITAFKKFYDDVTFELQDHTDRLVVNQLKDRVRNHENTIRIKHTHKLLGLKYPQRQPPGNVYYKELYNGRNKHRASKLVREGEANIVKKNMCRRCVWDQTILPGNMTAGLVIGPGSTYQLHYWCWEEERHLASCLHFGGIFFENMPDNEISNKSGCRRLYSGHSCLGQIYHLTSTNDPTWPSHNVYYDRAQETECFELHSSKVEYKAFLELDDFAQLVRTYGEGLDIVGAESHHYCFGNTNCDDLRSQGLILDNEDPREQKKEDQSLQDWLDKFEEIAFPGMVEDREELRETVWANDHPQR